MANIKENFHFDLLDVNGLYYRPQTKFGKIMFLHLSVSHSVHRGGVCLSASWYIHPPQSRHPAFWEQTPPRSRHPIGADTHSPGSRHPPEQTPPGAEPPRADTACWDIRATSGRYASYWNACLLVLGQFSGFEAATWDTSVLYLHYRLSNLQK